MIRNIVLLLVLFVLLVIVIDGLKSTSSISSSIRKRSMSLNSKLECLLFDCDGVIVETEELHRIAYNKAFASRGLKLPSGENVEWGPKFYDELSNTIGGGKPKMMYYFNNLAKAWPISNKPYKPAPKSEKDKADLVDKLQDAKTEFYKEIVDKIATARPQVLEIMDAAIADPNVKVGICSAATKAGFEKLVNSVVGKERLRKLDCVIAGDDVSKKKPDPMIYNVAKDKLKVKPENVVVIEDSLVGLKAAKGANMKCLITYTEGTKQADFYGNGADAAVPSLKDITYNDIKNSFDDLLASKRDPKSTSSEAPKEPEAPKKPKLPYFKGWTPHYTISASQSVTKNYNPDPILWLSSVYVSTHTKVCVTEIFDQ